MKKLLKPILKKLLFRGRLNPTAFPAVRIPSGEFKERFILKDDKKQVDVTDRHCIVCHSPFCIAVFLAPEEWSHFDFNSCEALIVVNNDVKARIELSMEMKFPDRKLFILKARSAENFQLSHVRQYLMRKYFRNKNSVLEDKFYAASYSFPRRVIAVSFKDDSYYNIFPMDFQCFLKESNMYILGLRTTNVTLEKILKKRRLVIGDTDKAEIKTLYALGQHHSSSPPEIASLPFSVVESEMLHFPVAEFSAGYKEIELIENFKIGTHMLLIGRVINTVERREWNSSIHHIHYFHSFSSKYPTA
jgi:flavin reductase (DIM6/NTAB) family NADH-FMN oxidoreductase RutF